MALLAYQATPAYPRPQHEDWLCYQRFAPMQPGQPYRSLINQQVPCLPSTNAGRQAHAVLQRYQQQVAARQPGALPLEQVEVFYLPALSLAGLLCIIKPTSQSCTYRQLGSAARPPSA